jgi:hypothetical protein
MDTESHHPISRVLIALMLISSGESNSFGTEYPSPALHTKKEYPIQVVDYSVKAFLNTKINDIQLYPNT